jgi:hypothetical protein
VRRSADFKTHQIGITTPSQNQLYSPASTWPVVVDPDDRFRAGDLETQHQQLDVLR